MTSIGIVNGSSPVWRQAITWKIADTVHRRIYTAPGGMSLTNYQALWHVMIYTHLCRQGISVFISLYHCYVPVEPAQKSPGTSPNVNGAPRHIQGNPDRYVLYSFRIT